MNTENRGFLRDRLQEERRRLGLTQKQMGALGGKPERTYQDWESGKAMPSVDYLLSIAQHGADMLFILTGHRNLQTLGALNAEEAAVLDNYRHATEAGRAAARAVLVAVEKQPAARRRRAAGGGESA